MVVNETGVPVITGWNVEGGPAFYVQARFEYYLVAHLCYNSRILSGEVVCPELSCAMEQICEAFSVCVIWAVLLGQGAENGGPRRNTLSLEAPRRPRRLGLRAGPARGVDHLGALR